MKKQNLHIDLDDVEVSVRGKLKDVTDLVNLVRAVKMFLKHCRAFDTPQERELREALEKVIK